MCGTLLESVPWGSITPYRRIRNLKETVNTPVFVKGAFTGGSGKKYKSTIETSVRGFIKAALSDSDRFGIPKDQFQTYNDIIKFIRGHDAAKNVKLSKTSISNLKCRNAIARTVPRTDETEGFIKYVTKTITTFDIDRFFKEKPKEKGKEKEKTNKR